MNSQAAKTTPAQKSRPNPSAENEQRLGEELTVIGRKLRDKREANGWTPELAAKKTKIKLPQILALEEGKLPMFASPSYARGFASIYLRTLGFDDRAELARYDEILDVHPEERLENISGVEYRPAPLPVETREGPSTLGYKVVILCTVVMMLVILGVGFQTYKAGMMNMPVADGIRGETGNLNLSQQTNADAAMAEMTELQAEDAPPAAVPVPQPAEEAAEATPARAEAVAIPAEAAEPEPDAPANGVYNIALVAQRRSFVSVVTHNPNGGTTRFTGTMKRGERRAFSGKKMEVMIAVPAAIHIVYNGEDQGPYSYSTVPASFTIPASN